jgi:hypothetical protein
MNKPITKAELDAMEMGFTNRLPVSKEYALRLIADHRRLVELFARLKRWGAPAVLLGLTDPEHRKDHAEGAEYLRQWEGNT